MIEWFFKQCKILPAFRLLGEPVCKMDRYFFWSHGKLLILERSTQNKTNRLHMKGLMNIYKWSQWTVFIITPLLMQEMQRLRLSRAPHEKMS